MKNKSSSTIKIIEDITNFLKKEQINLSKVSKDGRVNSILNEDEILKLIEKNYDIEIPRHRAWADFFIDEIPINIKITTTETADNASSKNGLYYALTGKIYVGNTSWHSFLKSLKENMAETDNDYYFLIINKKDSNDVFYNSLKRLNKVQPNGNNLPFQIKWNENRTPKDRTFEEAKKLLLVGLGKSIKLRADVYFSFKEYFNEFIE